MQGRCLGSSEFCQEEGLGETGLKNLLQIEPGDIFRCPGGEGGARDSQIRRVLAVPKSPGTLDAYTLGDPLGCS